MHRKKILIYIQQDATLHSLFYHGSVHRKKILIYFQQDSTLHSLFYHGSVHRKKILIYIQQDATLHSLFYLETALHVSGGTITHHQERKQLYLQHLVFVTPLLLPAATPADSSNGVTNNRYCRYSCLRS